MTLNLETLYTQLREYIEDIRGRLIQSHIDNELATPDEYNIDVKSFCILCHSAFEEFIESVCLKVMHASIDNYVMHSKISKPMISLMHFKSDHENYLDKGKEKITITEIETIFDYNRKKLDKIKESFSREIVDNHGISLKYLRKLMMPVSIDIPQEVKWNSSITKLANERGAYAHKFLESGRVKQSIEPEEAKAIVDDCLEFCDELKNRANSLVM